MARYSDYVSSDTGIKREDLSMVFEESNVSRATPVYLIDMATGDRTPIVAVMLDTEGDDAPNLYLYTEII
jgi:hypothetical protein